MTVTAIVKYKRNTAESGLRSGGGAKEESHEAVPASDNDSHN